MVEMCCWMTPGCNNDVVMVALVAFDPWGTIVLGISNAFVPVVVVVPLVVVMIGPLLALIGCPLECWINVGGVNVVSGEEPGGTKIWRPIAVECSDTVADVVD